MPLSMLVLIVLASLAYCSNGQEVLPKTSPQYIPFAKCNFVIYGEFDREQAQQACTTRNAFLGFFFSKSEEHATRAKINWNEIPGFQDGDNWNALLWIDAIRNSRVQGGFTWNNPFVGGQPISYAPWIDVPMVMRMRQQMMTRVDSSNGNGGGGNPMEMRMRFMAMMQQRMAGGNEHMAVVPTSPTATGTGDCVVIRKEGWMPMNCSGDLDGVKRSAGALCSTGARYPPNDTALATSNNYCGTLLLPSSQNAMAFPVVIQKRYFIVKGSFNFEQASRVCNDNSAVLTTSRSAEEHEFITKQLDFNLVGSRAWMSLKRSAPGSSMFLWASDGAPNFYTVPFLPNQPQNGVDCVSYERGANGKMGWKSTACTEQLSVVCEDFKFL